MAESTNNLGSIITRELQKLLEKTTVQTGVTLDAIANNPILKSIDGFWGLDWLMTFLGKVDTVKVKSNVEKIKLRYPNANQQELAHYLIQEKAWQAGKLGLITNIIPPIAALFLGVELIATAKLQAEMVYEIAAAYNLSLDEPARRGEVLAILGLSLGGDAIKTGLSLVEIIPGIGAIVGASANAAMLYVLGQTAARFYQNKETLSSTNLQEQTDEDWQIAVEQLNTMNQIINYMIQTTYNTEDWSEILPTLKKISPSSVKTVAVNLENPQSLDILLEQLSPEFAPLVLSRCYQIAKSNGEISIEEQKILSQIAIRFSLDLNDLKTNSD